MRDGTGQQVKIVLLSFWSVNRWVSQYPTLKGCFTDRAGIVNNLIYFPSTRQVDSSSWIFVLIENYIGTLSLTDDWWLITDHWLLYEIFWIFQWNVLDFPVKCYGFLFFFLISWQKVWISQWFFLGFLTIHRITHYPITASYCGGHGTWAAKGREVKQARRAPN